MPSDLTCDKASLVLTGYEQKNRKRATVLKMNGDTAAKLMASGSWRLRRVPHHKCGYQWEDALILVVNTRTTMLAEGEEEGYPSDLVPTETIDLDAVMWAEVRAEILNSPKFAEMYLAGGVLQDAVSDVVTWLKEPPRALLDRFEQLEGYVHGALKWLLSHDPASAIHARDILLGAIGQTQQEFAERYREHIIQPDTKAELPDVPPSVKEALTFIKDLAIEELGHAKIGTGAEVALRHIHRKANETLGKIK